ncbi:hypothetical protein M011DRAFT_466876, partial [Sporormia fimetaria CBS 119925]
PPPPTPALHAGTTRRAVLLRRLYRVVSLDLVDASPSLIALPDVVPFAHRAAHAILKRQSASTAALFIATLSKDPSTTAKPPHIDLDPTSVHPKLKCRLDSAVRLHLRVESSRPSRTTSSGLVEPRRPKAHSARPAAAPPLHTSRPILQFTG